jgi:hypothetical protein
MPAWRFPGHVGLSPSGAIRPELVLVNLPDAEFCGRLDDFATAVCSRECSLKISVVFSWR